MIPGPASVFSAFGIALSDIRQDYSLSEPQMLPVPPERLAAAFRELEELSGRRTFTGQLDGAIIQRAVDMRFRFQSHVVRVALPAGRFDEALIDALVQRFLTLYEEIYGTGTAYRDVGIELVTFRMSVVTPVPRPAISTRLESRTSAVRGLAARRARFSGEWIETPVYDLESLPPGACLVGPALLDGATTTVVVHPGQTAITDDLGNVSLNFSGAPMPGERPGGG